MSVEAMAWALAKAPNVPPSAVATLVGLANHASPDGTGAYPSTRILSRYTRKSERMVQRDLRLLVERGVIREGDQRRAGHLRADRRPVVYDLAFRRGDAHDTPSNEPQEPQK